MAKLIAIKSIHNSRETIWLGNIQELCTQVFGYTLDAGKSWENEDGCYKVNKVPKGAITLAKNLNNAANNLNHYSDSYSSVEVTKEMRETYKLNGSCSL